MPSGDFRQRVIFEVDDRASAETKKIERGFEGVASKVASLAGGTALVAGFVRVLGEFEQALRATANAAAEQESAQVRLNGAFLRAGQDIGGLSDLLDAQAQTLSRLGVATSTAVTDVQGLLASLGAAPGQIEGATQAAADLSVALGVDLTTAARQLGRTFGGFAGELGEIIPELKNLDSSALQAGGAIEILQERFGGASTDARTFEQAMRGLSEALNDVKVAIGEGQTSDSVVKQVDEFASTLRFAASTLEGSALSRGLSSFTEGLTEIKTRATLGAVSLGQLLGVLRDTNTVLVEQIQAQTEADAERRKAIQTEQQLAEATRIANEAMQNSVDRLTASADATKEFRSAVESLGVTLSRDINDELERNNETLERADLLYRSGEITRRDFEAIQRAVASAERDLRAELNATTDSLERQNRTLDRTSPLYDRARESVDAFNRSIERNTQAQIENEQALRRLGARLSSDLGVRAVTRSNQAAVELALARGIRPTLGGSRIRTPDGGSVLLEEI